MSMAIFFENVFYGDNDFTNFGAQLFRLIAKADALNRAKLSFGFPKEVELYQWWMDEWHKPSIEQMRAAARKLGESDD